MATIYPATRKKGVNKMKVNVCITKTVVVEVDDTLCQDYNRPQFIAEIERLTGTPSLYTLAEKEIDESKGVIYAAYNAENDEPLYED